MGRPPAGAVRPRRGPPRRLQRPPLPRRLQVLGRRVRGGSRRLRSGAPTVLTSAPDGDKAATFALNDVSSGKSFHAEAEGLRNRWWVGAKDGWLVTMDAGFDVELLNPATGDGVRLPSFTTIPRATIDRG
ncbi:hypothetical protein C2845_PM16G22270 [Panicum miliaceum]|uniref:KIB1-4 beta-propeller domain-containing protein n=1 Tax=Panicum miliaceum TaxID=4540 RepID=A0A3L6PX87_PANMI|nr:hypothetical protein C2845_PM16G22270 [Panicum miliaceum]